MDKTSNFKNGFRPSLVNKRNNAAKAENEEVKTDYNKLNRLNLYKAQYAAARIGVSRVRLCNIYTHDNSKVHVYSTVNERLAYANLIHCTSVWTCPICSYKIKNERKNEVKTIMQGMSSDKYRFVFLTLTKSHKWTLNPKEVKELFKKTNDDWRKITAMRQFKEYKKLYKMEFIKALEITYKDLNGFHPHLHIILAFDSLLQEFTPEQQAEEMQTVAEYARKKWLEMNPNSLEEFSKIKIVYEQDYENSLQEYITKLNLAYEMTNPYLKKVGSGVNPITLPLMYFDVNTDLLDQDHIKRIYNCYEKSSKGCRFMTYSKGLKKMYLMDEKTDAEICESTDELLDHQLSIDLEAWKKIVQVEKRGELLNLLEQSKQNEYANLHEELKVISSELKIENRNIYV